MRLPRVEAGAGLGAKSLFALVRLLSGHRAPDVIRVVKYRPELFGEPYGALTQRVMRGDSDWSVGERELFAAFVSHLNQCPF